MRQAAVVLASLFAGFVGGVLGAYTVQKQGRDHPPEVIRARAYELVNGAGREVSYWGFDKNDAAELVFGASYPADSPEARAAAARPAVNLREPQNQRITLGILMDEPHLHMNAVDGSIRAGLFVNEYGKAELTMDDENGTRVSLGHQGSDTGEDSNNWFLDFSPQRASMGMYTDTVAGHDVLRGALMINKNNMEFPNKLKKRAGRNGVQ